MCVTPLAQMESLATLSLDHNQIRDISPLATLTGSVVTLGMGVDAVHLRCFGPLMLSST